MDVRIRVLDEDPDDALEALTGWLKDEGMAGSVRLVRQAPADGQMGGMVDALTVAVGAGGSVSVLASALRTWLSQPRWSKVNVKVVVRPDGGREVEIGSDGIKSADLETVLEHALSRVLD